MGGGKNRRRSVRVIFYLDEAEAALLQEKMAEAGIRNREAYIRKMILDGYVLKLDFSDVRRMVWLLSNSSNNLNQIARRVNSGDALHAADIQTLQADYAKLWAPMRDVLKKLSKI